MGLGIFKILFIQFFTQEASPWKLAPALPSHLTGRSGSHPPGCSCDDLKSALLTGGVYSVSQCVPRCEEREKPAWFPFLWMYTCFSAPPVGAHHTKGVEELAVNSSQGRVDSGGLSPSLPLVLV